MGAKDVYVKCYDNGYAEMQDVNQVYSLEHKSVNFVLEFPVSVADWHKQIIFLLANGKILPYALTDDQTQRFPVPSQVMYPGELKVQFKAFRSQTDNAQAYPIERIYGECLINVNFGLSDTYDEYGNSDEIVKLRSDMEAHTADNGNPHKVEKAQLGLADVENTSIILGPVMPADQVVGGLWLQDLGQAFDDHGSVIVKNAIVSPTEVTDKNALWFDTEKDG